MVVKKAVKRNKNAIFIGSMKEYIQSPFIFLHGIYKVLIYKKGVNKMNQDDVILLGEILEEFGDNLPLNDEGKELLKKVKIVSQQAKASKEYQGLMDKLNTELSELGKDDENAKN